MEKTEGHLLGSEGSGTIEEVGSALDKNLKGKKVAFCHCGWSQYCVQDFDRLLIFDDKVDLKLAATSMINPLTALSLSNIVLDRGAKSCIFFGANSSLGRIFINLACQKGIEVLAIVRSDEEVNMLKKDLKLNQVFNYESSDFCDKFCSVIE